MQSIKVVCVGDGAVGKTSLLYSFAMNAFPDTYEPTVFDNYTANLQYNGQTYHLNLWDCAGQEDYKEMRKLSYPNTDVFLICFSVISPVSFKHIDEWIKEVQASSTTQISIVIACTKMDALQNVEILKLLKEKQIYPLSAQDIHVLKQKYTYPVIECSAKTGQNVQRVFTTIIDEIEHSRKHSAQTVCGVCDIQ